jgi:hypothetical protein
VSTRFKINQEHIVQWEVVVGLGTRKMRAITGYNELEQVVGLLEDGNVVNARLWRADDEESPDESI